MFSFKVIPFMVVSCEIFPFQGIPFKLIKSLRFSLIPFEEISFNLKYFSSQLFSLSTLLQSLRGGSRKLANKNLLEAVWLHVNKISFFFFFFFFFFETNKQTRPRPIEEGRRRFSTGNLWQPIFSYRVCHGFWPSMRDDYFWVTFYHFT